MSAKKSKAKRKEMTFLGYDPVEEPETVIANDKDENRKEAFKEAYKKVMLIIPEYFVSKKKKRKNTTAGGSQFTQNILVTPENAKIETKKIEDKGLEHEERERG